jgi:hypothetical protein
MARWVETVTFCGKSYRVELTPLQNNVWRASGRTEDGPLICFGYDLVSALEAWITKLERRSQ